MQHPACYTCFAERGEEYLGKINAVVDQLHGVAAVIAEGQGPLFRSASYVFFTRVYVRVLDALDDLDALMRSYQGDDGPRVSVDEILRSLNA